MKRYWIILCTNIDERLDYSGDKFDTAKEAYAAVEEHIEEYGGHGEIFELIKVYKRRFTTDVLEIED